LGEFSPIVSVFAFSGLLKISKVAKNILGLLFYTVDVLLDLTKTGWATFLGFWAILSKTNLVTLHVTHEEKYGIGLHGALEKIGMVGR
jgi:hypothetical protein